MDINAITEHVPAAIAAVAALLAAGWALLKFIAPLTKTTKDDDIVREHGDTIDDVIDSLEDRP